MNVVRAFIRHSPDKDPPNQLADAISAPKGTHYTK